MSLTKKFSKDKTKCNVTFTLPVDMVQEGKEVVLLGEFNNWEPSEGIVLKAKKGAFQTKVNLETGKRYEFRYLIDGHIWMNDETSDEIVANAYGTHNSVIILPAVAPVAKKPVAKKKVAAKVSKPKKAAKDKLSKIEGIGPKLASVLADAGIKTFADLSETKVSKIREILVAASSRYIMFNPTTWPKQAKLAAEGKWAELEKLQDELNGGV